VATFYQVQQDEYRYTRTPLITTKLAGQVVLTEGM